MTLRTLGIFLVLAARSLCVSVKFKISDAFVENKGPVFANRMLLPDVTPVTILNETESPMPVQAPNATAEELLAAAVSRPFLLSVGLPVLFRNSSAFVIADADVSGNLVLNESSSLSSSIQNVSDHITALHNDLRKAVIPSAGNMMQMHWDHSAAHSAQTWADRCSTNSSDSVTDRWGSGLSCGENMAVSPAAVTWDYVLSSWLDERQNFTYGTGFFSPGTEHYTQLVWAASHRVGCGYNSCEGFHVYVCHYCPSGNVIGEDTTPYLLGNPCETCPEACADGLCNNVCAFEDQYTNCEELDLGLGICTAKRYEHFRIHCAATCTCGS